MTAAGTEVVRPDPLTAEVLPDSRLSGITTPKGAVWCGAAGFQVPIYCASCGAEGGLVPQENMTFAFYLCQPCFEKHGPVTNTLVLPDEKFWETVKQEQLEQHGRLLSAEELLEVVEADASPLATLIQQGR